MPRKSLYICIYNTVKEHCPKNLDFSDVKFCCSLSVNTLRRELFLNRDSDHFIKFNFILFIGIEIWRTYPLVQFS